MGDKIKRSFRAYAAWNYEKEEKYINDQSKEGWQLIKGGCFHSVYKRDDSKRYIYKIDYNTVTTNKNNERKRYIQMFEELGWEFVNSTYNGWNYFKKPYDEHLDNSEYEIYTDDTSYNEMLQRWCKLGKVVFVIELLAAVIYTLMAIVHFDISIAIEACIFWFLFMWIKSGLNIMNEKIK